MTTRRATVLATLALLVPGASAESARGALEPVAATFAEITYVAPDLIHIAAGRDQGLDTGDVVEVLHGDAIVATLEITGISSRRSSAVRLTGDAPIAVGDRVRFVARSRAPAVMDEEPIKQSLEEKGRPKKRRSLREWGFRGRIGLRYLAVRDRSGRGVDFSQPALDLKLTGVNVGGSGLGLVVDMRSRRTYRSTENGGRESSSRQRLYRLAGSWDGKGKPWRVTVGRQYAPALANVSVFDGVLAEWHRERWSAGAFVGAQPDALDFEFSSAVKERGLYYERRGGPKAKARWSVTTGAVGSYTAGEVNREFLFVQGRYFAERFSLYAIQELDYNRDWRKEAEGSSFSSTSTYTNLRYRVSDGVELSGGYDNRRRIRYYRDFVTPETEFDDSYRQGVWGRVGLRFSPRYRVALSTRLRSGGSSGSADSHTVTFSASRLGSRDLDVRSRSTRYSNDRTEGWLHSASVGAAISPRLRVELGGGTRTEETRDGFDARDIVWYGLDLDVHLGSRWFWLASVERTSGDDEDNDQLYTTLVYRF